MSPFLFYSIALLCTWPYAARTFLISAKSLSFDRLALKFHKDSSNLKDLARQSFKLFNVNNLDDNRADDLPLTVASNGQHVSALPCGDKLDNTILKIFLPAILNFAIVPLVGAADTFWVGRMHNALALAGQGAANQLFNSVFLLFSFLPNVITPLIAKAHGAGDKEAVRDRVGEALFIAIVLGALGTALLVGAPDKLLSLLLKDGLPARQYALPYLRIRSLTFLPAILSTVGFAVFRGTLDVVSPLFISLLANLVNVLLDPLLIFNAGMGVSGAAAATCLSELASVCLYAKALIKGGFLRPTFFRPPSRAALVPLLLGGLSMQIRSLSLNIALISVNRVTQALDSSGTAAAAHTISLQMFQLGSVASMALSTVAAIIIPTERSKMRGQGEYKALKAAKQAGDRLLWWSILGGMALGGLQLLLLPLLSVFSPLPHVQEAAKLPTIIGASLQFLNCVVWTMEGVQQGMESFLPLAFSTALATLCMMLSLQYTKNTLFGAWASFGVLALVRLIAVLRFHFFSGPLSPQSLSKAKERENS